MASNFLKDPDAVLDYTVDWTAWLGSDTIATSTWIVPTGLTLEDESNTSTAATAWVSGGTDGEQYALTNRITTADGRTDDRSIRIAVRNR